MYTRTEDLKGFDRKYVESLWKLGIEYVSEFYESVYADREPMKNYLGVDDSELERLLKLAETVLDKELIEEAKNPPEPHPRGAIFDDETDS